MRNMIKAVVIKSNGKRHRTKALLRWKDSTKKENNYQTGKSEDEMNYYLRIQNGWTIPNWPTTLGWATGNRKPWRRSSRTGCPRGAESAGVTNLSQMRIGAISTFGPRRQGYSGSPKNQNGRFHYGKEKNPPPSRRRYTQSNVYTGERNEEALG